MEGEGEGEGEGEDDWGRGRGGRTAVAREGRMVEARWRTKERKQRGRERKLGKRKGRKETLRLFSLRAPPSNQNEEVMNDWRDDVKKNVPAGVPLGKAL